MKKTKEEMKMLWKKIKPLSLLLILGVALALAMHAVSFFPVTLNKSAQQNNSKNFTATVSNAFENISLEAHAAYVFDIHSKQVLYAFHENDKLPLASITKLMTAFVARDHASENALLVLSKDDLATEGDSGLRLGERWRLGDLLNTMLIISSNDAAHAVARFIGGDEQPAITEGQQDSARTRFVQMMNQKAHELGLAQTEFFNESGLDISSDTPGGETINGGYGSAHDVAVLFSDFWTKYASTVEITALPAARITSQDNIVHVLPNTDEAIGKFSGLIASKTGYTTLAGGNLAIIFDRGINDPVVAVVLGSSYSGRFDDMAKLVTAVGRIE